MPRTATEYRFSPAQAARIQHFLPEFQELVLKFDPTFKGNCKPLSDWKTATVAQLFSEDIFQDLDTKKHSLKKWGEAIKRIYSNHFGYQMKVNGTGLDGTPQTTVAPVNVQPAKSSDKIRSFLFFSGDISPRELFAAENHNELEAAYKRICRDTGLPGGPARQAALKELWAKADQKEWEERAKTYLNDTKANQEEFSRLALSSLEAMLSRGVLGSSMISMMYAYRGLNDCVCTEILSTGFNSRTGAFIEYQIDDQDLTETWTKMADRHLPRSKSLTPLAYNEDGIPLFPSIDPRSLNLNEMIKVLEDYFNQLWAHIRSGSAIPWDDIAANPEEFYDTWLYEVPCTLKPPPALEDDDVLRLTKFLIRQTSKDTPFLFRPKAIISHKVDVQATKDLLAAKSSNDARTSPAPTTQETAQPSANNTFPPTSTTVEPSFPSPAITASMPSTNATPTKSSNGPHTPPAPAPREPTQTGTNSTIHSTSTTSLPSPTIAMSTPSANAAPLATAASPLKQIQGKEPESLEVGHPVEIPPAIKAPHHHAVPSATPSTVPAQPTGGKKGKKPGKTKPRPVALPNADVTASTVDVAQAGSENAVCAVNPNGGQLRRGSRKRKTIDHSGPQPIVDPTSGPPPGKKVKPSWDWVPVIPKDSTSSHA